MMDAEEGYVRNPNNWRKTKKEFTLEILRFE